MISQGWLSFFVVGLGDLPDASMLAGVPEFGLQQSKEQEAAGTVAKLMSQLTRTSDMPVQSLATSATGEGLPALPKKWVERIQAGEYTDFAELPPAKGKARGMPKALDGQILVVQAVDLMETRRVIPDLATWVQCFSVYMAVIVDKEPDRAKNLLAYLSTIAKCSQKFRWPSWIVYDQNFRQDAAETGKKDWSKVEPSIYTQCFTGASVNQEGWCRQCHSVDHGTESCPVKPPAASRKARAPQAISAPPAMPATFLPPRKRPPPHSSPEPCRKFNMHHGDCKFGDHCIYQHRCDSCGDYSHPSSRCSKPRKGGP